MLGRFFSPVFTATTNIIVSINGDSEVAVRQQL